MIPREFSLSANEGAKYLRLRLARSIASYNESIEDHDMIAEDSPERAAEAEEDKARLYGMLLAELDDSEGIVRPSPEEIEQARDVLIMDEWPDDRNFDALQASAPMSS